jgi:hypothetical protein
MGAWAVDAFGNDDACDWANGLSESKDLTLVESTLSKVLAVGDEYLESPEATEGIAAAETVARLQGNFGEKNSYTEEVDKWVSGIKIKTGTELANKAHAVIDRILIEPSELLELWQDSDDFDAWKASVLNVKSRIHV